MNARSWYKNRTIRIHERVIDYTSRDRRRRKQAKKRRGRKKTGGKGEQNAGVGTELSNGCEYIAVINFAKTRKGEERTSRGLLGRPVSRQSGLRAWFLRERGGTTKKSRRKAVKRERGEAVTFPVRTLDGHVSPGSANRLAAFVEGLKQPYGQWSSTPRERSSDGSIESCNPRFAVTPPNTPPEQRYRLSTSFPNRFKGKKACKLTLKCVRLAGDCTASRKRRCLSTAARFFFYRYLTATRQASTR